MPNSYWTCIVTNTFNLETVILGSYFFKTRKECKTFIKQQKKFDRSVGKENDWEYSKPLRIYLKESEPWN